MIAHNFLDCHLYRALRHAMADEENCLCIRLEIKYFKFVIKLTTSNLTLQFDGIRLKTSFVMIVLLFLFDMYTEVSLNPTCH